MKILHLPYNVASQISVTVRAQRDLGVDARGLVFGNPDICDATGIEVHSRVPGRKFALPRVRAKLKWWRAVERAIDWADVVHYHTHGRPLPWAMDLKIASWRKKTCVVEFWGSDIRIADIASRDNPYFAAAMQSCHEMMNPLSRECQARYARYGCDCIIPGVELRSYVQSDLFPKPYRVRQRLILSEFEPHFPDPNSAKPIIVHAPSHKGKKGSQHVQLAVDKLEQQGLQFEYRVIHNVSRQKAKSIVRGCDIFVDQFVLGDHGLASVEAMALGKPTVCYIKPSIVSQFPAELPIVNANQDDLPDVLAHLIQGGAKRHELGRRGRAYVEKYHDAHDAARRLLDIYHELIARSNPGVAA